jgi:hypothetical protein
MKTVAKIVAIAGLLLTIGPPAWAFLAGVAEPSPSEPYSGMSDGLMKALMAVGAILWFAAAPKWLKEDRS